MGKKISRIFKLTGLAAGAAALGYAIKKKRVEPVSLAKKTVRATKVSLPDKPDYENGSALTPPMGWSSWNTFSNNIDENLIYDTALAMKKSGLADAGYNFVNLDDCWQSSLRDENNCLQGDLVRFKSGIKGLVEKINELGLKVGIYSSNGSLTCEDLPASLGNEAIDALTFARWGVEYFKYDFCYNVPSPARAPFIAQISISKAGEDEQVFEAKDAVLDGEARFVEDEKLDNGLYIAGLSAGGGSAVFENIVVEEAGEYVLTLVVRKKSNSFKYCEIEVNGQELYTSTFPPTKAWNAQGRQQLLIKLKKGENSIKLYNPVASRMDSSALQYINMGQELKKATALVAKESGQPEKPITYSICEWGLNMPWKWGRKAGNLWRTTPDIKAFWLSIVGIYEVNVLLHKHAKPGSWNDPDMLEVGNGNLSNDENIAHFSLWCMMAAPLILGNDIRKFLKDDGSVDEDNYTLKVVSNKDMIAVNQDELGLQCRRIKTTGFCDTLLKPLKGEEVALCFFNKSSEEKVFEQKIQELAAQMFVDLPYADSYEVYDLWDKTKEELSHTIFACVPPHGVKVYRIKAKQ